MDSAAVRSTPSSRNGASVSNPTPDCPQYSPLSCHHLLSIVEDACTMIRYLSYLTKDADYVLDRLDQAVDNEVRECSEQYRSSLSLLKDGYSDGQIQTKFASAVWSLCCILRKRQIDMGGVVGEKQDHDLVDLYELFQKFRVIALKRLSTSLEEERAIEAYRNEIIRREAKAVKDLAALEQQLQMERDERSKELAQYEDLENQLNSEREQVKSEALATERQLDTDFKLLEEQESKAFEEQEKSFMEECAQLRNQLEKAQLEDREMELTLRGKKEQTIEEVIGLLRDYDQDVKSRLDEIQKLTIEHADVNKRLKIIQAYFDEKEREEAKRQEEEEKEAELKATELQRLHCTKVIQCAWRAYLKKKAAETAHHKKSKKEGKGKGKASKDDKKENDSSKSKKAGSGPVKKTKK